MGARGGQVRKGVGPREGAYRQEEEGVIEIFIGARKGREQGLRVRGAGSSRGGAHHLLLLALGALVFAARRHQLELVLAVIESLTP